MTNQGIVAEINLAIGAKGVVSNECKMVVDQYGDQIIELLLEQVYMCRLALRGQIYFISKLY